MKLKYFTTLALSALLPLQIYAQPVTTSSNVYIEKSCPVEDPFHIVVNKQQPITSEYIPDPLVIPNVKFSFSGTHEKKHMEATAAAALEELFNAGKAENIHLVAVSGYRSYTRQSQIYNSYVARDGQAKADTYSARPGTSEHQTGLTIDVSSASAGYALTEKFGQTKEGQWLANNAHHYGFIIRYPKGKESITGYIYEPWHIRYVGKELATKLYSQQLTLEELETCCEPPSPLVALLPSTPIAPPPTLLDLNNINIHIDPTLKDLNITIDTSDGGINISITPAEPNQTSTEPTTPLSDSTDLSPL